jgi:hypothetical protein
MNAERLHAIARSLRAELDEADVPTLVRQLAEALQQQVGDPSQPAHQETVSNLRRQLDETLRQAPSNDFSPAWRQTVGEVGVDDLLGDTLRERIREIFERNEITPASAATELVEIADRIEAFSGALTQLLESFAFFDIGAEQLAPGEFEIGFLIPREAVGNELKELGREFVKLQSTLNPFLELAEGSRPKLEVRSISSSAFQAFLLASPGLALLLAKTVESLITSYEKILSIRDARQQLKQSAVPDAVLAGLGKYVTELMEAEIEKLAAELVAELRKKNDDRANELETELKRSLRELANRIDRGYNIDVRAGELPEPEVDEEGNLDLVAQDPELTKAVKTVTEKQRRLRFMNLSGKPILELPEGPGENEADKRGEDPAGGKR